MPFETQGFSELMTDIAQMASAMDADGAGAPLAKRILQDAAKPIHDQAKANASSNPKIISGVLHRSIQIGPVRKRRTGGKRITIGVHRKEKAYYATPGRVRPRRPSSCARTPIHPSRLRHPSG